MAAFSFIVGTAALGPAVFAAEPDAAAIAQPTDVQLAPSPALTEPATVVDDAAQPGDTIAYPTLAAAVAAQPDHDGDDAAIRCLAGAIYHESKGEPLAGQLGVAEVILNRARSGRFPADVCGVVTQPGQFGFVRGGRIPAIDGASRAYRTAIAVAKVALADAWDGAADTALYFNRGRPPAAGLRKVAAIGNHIFWR